MKYNITDVTGSQKFVGQKLWICDFRKEVDKKAVRHVSPTEVYVAGHSDFEAAGLEPRIYYSIVGFAKLKKDGTPNLKQLISPYDTTGYRSYAGVGVLVFDNEKECIDAYNEQIKVVLEKYNSRIKTVMASLLEEMEQIKNQTIKPKD